MPETKRPLKVFLCHASADKPKVQELYRYLRRRGIQPWLDVENLIPGQNWEIEIPKAIQTSDAIIICLTKNSIDKEGYVQKEIRFALDKALEMPEGRIFLIPARLEECDLPYSLRQYQWVNLYEEAGYSKLMRALKLRASQLQRADIEVSRQPTPVKSKQKDIVPIPAQALEVEEEEEKLAQRSNLTATSKSGTRKRHRKWNTTIIVALIGFAGTIIAALLGSPLVENWFSSVAVPTTMGATTMRVSQTPNTQESVVTSAFLATQTESSVSTSTETPILTSISAPLPTEIADSKGVKMVLVPAGEFTMGSDSGAEDEQPVHSVYLDAFYIDIYEVTNALYKACVDADVCNPPKQTDSVTHSSYYGSSDFDNYPVIYVDWNMAKTYCEWRDAQLPTEAQWEKAARGADGRIFPWGNTFNGNLLNFCDKNCSRDWADQSYDDGYSDIAPVGNYKGGISLYGVYDLAGNVWEWVADWYDSNYYASSSSSNPPGPNSGEYHTLRGGSWDNDEDGIRASNRVKSKLGAFNPNFGFRCAKDTSP